jgi:predicted metal-dependent peptidase
MAIKEDFDKIKATLMAISPFMSALLRRAKIILSESIPTACVTASYTVVVNPSFLDSLGYADKTWVLGHETVHIAFDHVKRGRVQYPMVWNLAADAVVNNMLEDFIRCSNEIKRFSIRMHDIQNLLYQFNIQINYDELERMTVEEIYRLLLKIPWPKEPGGDICERDLEGRGDPGGEVLQDGDSEIYGKGTPAEVADEWRKAIVKAYTQQKVAGKVPAGLKRLVDDILQAKVDWRALLRQGFHNGFGKTIVSTWRRPSRKHADFPGVHRFTYPRVHCLVDCSGSISEKELEQFIGEIYALAKQSPVSVRAWDAEAYEEIKAESQREVVSKVVKMLKGGGGTVIKPALQRTLELMRPRDIVVVLTDGEIWDIDEADTRRLFSEVASKSSVSILASTHRTLDIPLWHFVRVMVD